MPVQQRRDPFAATVQDPATVQAQGMSFNPSSRIQPRSSNAAGTLVKDLTSAAVTGYQAVQRDADKDFLSQLSRDVQSTVDSIAQGGNISAMDAQLKYRVVSKQALASHPHLSSQIQGLMSNATGGIPSQELTAMATAQDRAATAASNAAKAQVLANAETTGTGLHLKPDGTTDRPATLEANLALVEATGTFNSVKAGDHVTSRSSVVKVGENTVRPLLTQLAMFSPNQPEFSALLTNSETKVAEMSKTVELQIAKVDENGRPMYDMSNKGDVAKAKELRDYVKAYGVMLKDAKTGGSATLKAQLDAMNTNDQLTALKVLDPVGRWINALGNGPVAQKLADNYYAAEGGIEEFTRLKGILVKMSEGKSLDLNDLTSIIGKKAVYDVIKAQNNTGGVAKGEEALVFGTAAEAQAENSQGLSDELENVNAMLTMYSSPTYVANLKEMEKSNPTQYENTLRKNKQWAASVVNQQVKVITDARAFGEALPMSFNAETGYFETGSDVTGALSNIVDNFLASNERPLGGVSAIYEIPSIISGIFTIPEQVKNLNKALDVLSNLETLSPTGGTPSQFRTAFVTQSPLEKGSKETVRGAIENASDRVGKERKVPGIGPTVEETQKFLGLENNQFIKEIEGLLGKEPTVVPELTAADKAIVAPTGLNPKIEAKIKGFSDDLIKDAMDGKTSMGGEVDTAFFNKGTLTEKLAMLQLVRSIAEERGIK